MYHVLLALDETESRAVAQANAIISLPESNSEVKASLLHSFTDNPSGASALQIASVRRAQEALEDAGVETHVVEASGNPADVILDVAEEQDVDCVCVGGRRRSPAGKALFGSVAQSVILNADRPVLVTGGGGE
ncbi:Universal stress protein family protein [Haladaptatus litoreus]|uniref:Universal stress protein family protein n=1 Tax=Haladaptatus litoreus TaxID=553468 RepID=A0A1N6WU64_9EURY|nr:universal stress protein [Haladaptatus litoreus]SIQ93643.1 Universal stress protein family protein [Haladaptatus litoreus]